MTHEEKLEHLERQDIILKIRFAQLDRGEGNTVGRERGLTAYREAGLEKLSLEALQELLPKVLDAENAPKANNAIEAAIKKQEAEERQRDEDRFRHVPPAKREWCPS